MAKFTCSLCSSSDPIPPAADECPTCKRSLDAPNVRAAGSSEEVKALARRVGEAEAETKARGCVHVLDGFAKSVLGSSAVICRPLSEIKRLISSSSQLYATYYNQVEGNSRLPEDNEYDRMREQADTIIFPGYHKNIVFAALTLDDTGPLSYGEHSIILRDEAISHRASVFEENTLTFCQRHNLGVGNSLPVGYRATWKQRAEIAKAKLHALLNENTTKDEYPDILLTQANEMFIEVHIYKGFNRGAISRIRFGETKHKADALVVKSLLEKMAELNIQPVTSLNEEDKVA